jgi:hypothetical protein
MDLREYEQIKFDLAEILRSLQPYLRRDHRDYEERLRGLFSRLAEDRFNLVVAGRFSRGKTSLMNAVLGTISIRRSRSRRFLNTSRRREIREMSGA